MAGVGTGLGADDGDPRSDAVGEPRRDLAFMFEGLRGTEAALLLVVRYDCSEPFFGAGLVFVVLRGFGAILESYRKLFF